MNKKQSHITDDVLVRYLLGDSSETEQKNILQWINESDSNTSNFAQLKQIWEESGKLAVNSTVNVDEAWERFKERIQGSQKAGKTIPLTNSTTWLKAAAVLLLLIGTGWLGRSLIRQKQTVVTIAEPTYLPLTDTIRKMATVISDGNATLPGEKNTGVMQVDKSSKTQVSKMLPTHLIGYRPKTDPNKSALALSGKINPAEERKNVTPFGNNYSPKEFICNATPCPMEICIIQNVRCNDSKPSAIATCSILEPDQSGQIPYKVFDKIAADCATSIQEIRIKRISTGETIVLTADSKPSTAQDVFNFLTGEKKGDALADIGTFHSDCNNANKVQRLTIDNNLGTLVLH